MRVFWIILTLIIAGSGIAVFVPKPETNKHPALPAATQSDVIPEAAVEIPAPTTTPIKNEAVAIIDADELEEITETIDTVIARKEEVPAVVPEISADDIIASLNDITDTIEETAPIDTETNGWKMLAAQTEIAAEGDPITSTSPGEADEQNTSYGSGSEITTPNTKTPVEISPSLSVTQNDDGSMTIGETYTITGKGTKQNPYVMSWEFLVSLREFYNPREGKKAIPAHIAMFNGKYITIPGYLQFPLATPEPVECLVMLNQWDGCCIGVPPTPYDAIEVSLSEPASREQKFAVEGRIVGKLKIDPYLVGNWLIGLYLLTDASVDVSGARSVEEVFGNPLPQFDPTTE